MSEHGFTRENLEAYLAGGLTPAECARIEQHVASCAECTHALAEARQLEEFMSNLFFDAKPNADLEARTMRKVRRLPLGAPRWVRYVMSAAAVLAFAAVGAIVQAVATDGGGLFGARSQTFSSVGRQLRGDAVLTEALSSTGHHKATTEQEKVKELYYSLDRLSDVSVPGAVDPRDGVGILGKDSQAPPVNLPAPGGFGGKGQGGALGGYAGAGCAGGYGGYGCVGGIGAGGIPLGGSFYGRSGASREGREGAKDAPLSIPEEERLSDLRLGGAAPYYKPADAANQTPGKSAPPTPPASNAKKEPPVADNGAPVLRIEADKGRKSEEDQTPDGFPNAGRKIIRTGEIDFETDSFDNAVKTIQRILAGIKGNAFVATVNSDKLPNGKMRGSVVVRMQPIFLDKFIDDLRQEIGKTGELKSQRIGSADITKQYTDIESELRAARAVEERFLRIIKDGKGEIKDLVAAEKELGLWRTKIEKLEGEKRYFDNQVALSTLTIHLTEKEIEAPFALVRNEKVQMRLEVEEVKKALEAAVAAVDSLKGRVLKSESRQHKAGQWEAVLHAEIPPAQRDAFRAQIGKLGLVTEDEAAQKTQAQGGRGKAQDIKPRINDILFEVTMNNIVNIQPRHSVTLDIASNNVAASFTKLQDAIIRVAKGQVRVANLNEPDKQRVTAVLDFNVPKEQKEAIDKLVAELGPVLKKSNVQAPVTEVATDQKFGFVVNLYSVATIPPRERVTLRLQVDDVAGKAAVIEAVAKEAKGQAERGKFTQSPGGQTSTAIVLHLPLAASDSLLEKFMKVGKVLERDSAPNPQAPENELATAQVIVTLQGGTPIVPTDEGLWAKMQSGLYIGFTALAWSVIAIFTGVLILAPWILAIWSAMRLFRWLGVRKEIPAAEKAPAA